MKILQDGLLFKYSVLTSVFSGLVTGAMGLYTDMYDVMVGGLLHNVGCMEMPFLIGVKDLKDQQLLLWKEHPVYGYYFSIQQNVSRDIAKIILHHHENWDGSGYPNQLTGEEIPLGARIINVCSTVSSKIYYEHVQPYEAMEYIYGGSNMFFDKKIVDAFVGNITLYPLGAMVRLTTGEVGIVSNVRKNFGPRPIVHVFYNRFNKPLSEPIIVDLGKERTVFISEILN
jgi:HD-GYP domain-containing protein (c-di-GMP phosphodiesterase class II)